MKSQPEDLQLSENLLKGLPINSQLSAVTLIHLACCKAISASLVSLLPLHVHTFQLSISLFPGGLNVFC